MGGLTHHDDAVGHNWPVPAIAETATLSTLIDDGARAHPERPVLIGEDFAPVTWRQLAAARDHWAHRLREAGVGPGDRVVVHLTTSPTLVAAMFGLYRLGATAVMSNTAHTAREVIQSGRTSGAGFVLASDEDLSGPLRSVSQELGAVAIAAEQTWTANSGAPALPPDPSSAETIATVIFTSGTTAAAKGVPYTHGNHLFAGQVVVDILDLDPEDVFLHLFPLFHMNGHGHLVGALAARATIVLVPRYRTADYRRWIREFRPTKSAINATHVKMLQNDPDRLTPEESSLRLVQLGLKLAPELYDAFEDEFGARLVESFGMTESISLFASGSPTHTVRETCGFAGHGYEIRIVDPEGSPVPNGVDGELLVRSEHPFGLMTGYLGDQPSPLVDGWLSTGDIARIEDKHLVWIAREKEIIKRAGENIAPVEVESVLESHPGVVEAAVFGVPDDIREELPKALVVIRPGHLVTERDLRQHCGEQLAAFKVPAIFEFVSSLPRNSVGKVSRKDLT